MGSDNTKKSELGVEPQITAVDSGAEHPIMSYGIEKKLGVKIDGTSNTADIVSSAVGIILNKKIYQLLEIVEPDIQQEILNSIAKSVIPKRRCNVEKGKINRIPERRYSVKKEKTNRIPKRRYDMKIVKNNRTPIYSSSDSSGSSSDSSDSSGSSYPSDSDPNSLL